MDIPFPPAVQPWLTTWGDPVPVEQARGSRWGQLMCDVREGHTRLLQHTGGLLTAIADLETARRAHLHSRDFTRVSASQARMHLGTVMQDVKGDLRVRCLTITRYGLDLGVLIPAVHLAGLLYESAPVELGPGHLDADDLLAKGLHLETGLEGDPASEDEPGWGPTVVVRVLDERAQVEVAVGAGATLTEALATITATRPLSTKPVDRPLAAEALPMLTHAPDTPGGGVSAAGQLSPEFPSFAEL